MSPTEEKTELVPRGIKLLKFRTLFTFLARLFVLCIQFFKGEPRNTTPYFRNKQFLAISNSFSFRHFARTKKGPRICLATVCILFAIYFGICSNDGRKNKSFSILPCFGRDWDFFSDFALMKGD